MRATGLRAGSIGLCCAAAVSCIGCSDDQARELIVQLFRPRGMALSQLEVIAREGGKQGRVALGDVASFFSSCQSNRVRIIPAAQQGPGALVIEVQAAEISTVTRSVVLPASEPLRVQLGPGALEPAACAPTGMPSDGAVDTADAAAEGGTRENGEPCSASSQCAGGVCLQDIDVFGKTTALPGGYCTKDCATEACGGQDQCFVAQDGNGKQVGAYCLKHCTDKGQCRGGEGYTCTTNNACFPQ